MTTDETATAPLYIGLFGQIDVRCDDAPMKPLRSRKGSWLLALLALRQGRAVEREWLAGTLWPDSLQSDALYNLRRSLADLRQAMGAQGARISGPTIHTISLGRDDVFVDATAFDAAVERGDRASLVRAIALYRGPLLEGCAEEWAPAERAPREQAYLQALESLAKLALAERDMATAIAHLGRLLATDPLRESTVRLLIQAQAEQGNYAAAVQTYRQLRLRLHADLNADPDPETVALYRQLRATAQGQIQADVAHVAPPAPAISSTSSIFSISLPGHAIPRTPDPLIGRERELETVVTLLRSARLVTLTGIGGVGKTRLALAVAEMAAEDFRDGVCLVELADLRNPRDVPAALALAIGLKPTTDDDLQDAIVARLCPQQSLLLLDNFEQVVDAAPFISLLLQNCPQITCLITSRQLLQIRGEHEFGVEPLPLPERDCAPDAVPDCASVRLFIDRAQAARPDFRLIEANVDTVAEICRRLEGLPLAVELTAALIRGLTPQQILPRLQDRFRLLASTRRDLTARQRSLRGAFDWSYDLLEQTEQEFFVALSVFAGSFTIEAAETVCGTEDAFALLLALRDKSLLKASEADDVMRYAMLETVRDYAREKRAGMPREDELCARHADHFLLLAQGWGASIWSGDDEGEPAGRSFEMELANIRTGMDWAVERREPARAVPYSIALFRFLFTRGLYAEAEARLLAAEEIARAAGDSADVAGLLNRRGMIAWNRSEYPRAQALFEGSYTISRALDDRTQTLLTLPNLGSAAWAQLDYVTAQRVWEEALALAIDADNVGQQALLYDNLGILAMDRGGYEQAERYFIAALDLYHQDAQQIGAAETLCSLCELRLKRGDYAAALARAEEAKRMFTALSHQPGLSWSLALIGKTLFESGDVEAARIAASEGLEIAAGRSIRQSEMFALEVLARIAVSQGDWERGRRLFVDWHEIARRVKSTKHMIEAIFRYGLALQARGDLVPAYRLLRFVADRFGKAGLEDGRTAVLCCKQISALLTAEQTQLLDRVPADLSPENALDGPPAF